MSNELIKSKSMWAGALLIVFAGAGYFTGMLTVDKAIESGLVGLGIIGLRHGIYKQE